MHSAGLSNVKSLIDVLIYSENELLLEIFTIFSVHVLLHEVGMSNNMSLPLKALLPSKQYV